MNREGAKGDKEKTYMVLLIPSCLPGALWAVFAVQISQSSHGFSGTKQGAKRAIVFIRANHCEGEPFGAEKLARKIM